MTHSRETIPDADPALTEALAGWRTRGRLSDEAVRALKSRRRRVIAGATAGVAAVLLAVGLLHAPLRPVPDRIAHLQTGRGEARAVRLADGTTMRLEGATRLSIRYGTGERIVTLADGAAFFDVAHDPQRPFTVHAGDGDVRVLGTAFHIDRTAGRMALSVYRGAVRMAGRDDARGERVAAGWRGQVVGGHAGAIARLTDAAPGAQGDWIDTDGLRLADLVSILNRRPGRLILPPPPALADMSISGRFRTDDPQSLLQALGVSYGFSVALHDETLRLSPI